MIIAHDLGTTGNKASLHDERGNLLLATTIEYETSFRHGGIAEQDPEDWWRAVCGATRQLVAEASVSASEISGVVVSGQMMGAVFLDGDYRPVYPSIIWADSRSAPQTRRLIDIVGKDRAYRSLGHQLNPTYSIEKVMWVRDNEPEVWAQVRHICLAKDYINFRLTHEFVTEPSDASSTNAFDQDTGDWSQEILDAADLDHGLLPPVMPSTAVIGTVVPEAARHVGLNAGTPVVCGGGDGPMAAVGAGVVAPSDNAYVCLGSSSWVSCASTAPLHDPKMRSMTFNHVVPGHFVPTATMQAGAASVSWAYSALKFGNLSLAEAIESAGDGRAAATGLYFLPHLMGERSPYWNENAAGVFAGLRRFHTPADMMLAVLEGVGFNLATCMGAFRDAGRGIEGVDAIAGGALSDTWLQTLANLWGIPVRRRTVVRDANSTGAAVTALVGLEKVRDFSVARELSHISAEFMPEMGLHRRYLDYHQHFLDAYSRLEPWFEAVKEET